MVGHERDQGAEDTPSNDVRRMVSIIYVDPPLSSVSPPHIHPGRHVWRERGRERGSPIVRLTAINVAPIRGAMATHALTV